MEAQTPTWAGFLNLLGNTSGGPKWEQARESVEHLSHEIFPPKRRHIIKVSTCLLLCSLIWLHQNQMEHLGFLYEQRELGENKRSILFLNDKFEVWSSLVDLPLPTSILHYPADILSDTVDRISWCDVHYYLFICWMLAICPILWFDACKTKVTAKLKPRTW